MGGIREQTFLILTSLVNGPQHGYGIIKDVEQLTEGATVLRTGTLYGALDRLIAGDHVEHDHDETVSGRLRRYYRLTEQGHSLLVAETDRRRRIAAAAHRRLRRASAELFAAGGAP